MQLTSLPSRCEIEVIGTCCTNDYGGVTWHYVVVSVIGIHTCLEGLVHVYPARRIRMFDRFAKRRVSSRYDNRHQESTDPLFLSEDFLANQGLLLEDIVASDMCSDLRVNSK